MKCKLCGMPMKTQYDSDKSYTLYCDCRKMVPLDEVENLADKYGDPYEIIKELRKKYGVE